MCGPARVPSAGDDDLRMPPRKSAPSDGRDVRPQQQVARFQGPVRFEDDPLSGVAGTGDLAVVVGGRSR